MSTLTLCLFFLSIVLGERLTEGQDSHPGLKDPQCLVSGPQCSSDCANVIFCTEPEGTSVVIEQCKNGLLCDANYLNCSATTCDSGSIKHGVRCTGQGLFPDAYDCTKNYLCGEDKAPVAECQCAAEEIYNSGDETCVPSTITNCCRRNKVKCSKAGEIGGFGVDCVDDQQFYYLCVYNEDSVPPGLVGIVFKCPGDQIFNNSSDHKPICKDIQSAKNNSRSSCSSRNLGTCKRYDPPARYW